MKAVVRTPAGGRVSALGRDARPGPGPKAWIQRLHGTIDLAPSTPSRPYEASMQQLAAECQRLINLGTEGEA